MFATLQAILSRDDLAVCTLRRMAVNSEDAFDHLNSKSRRGKL
jgi:hypothetical protein